MSTHAQASSSNVVGVHYRVGKKIGEGSFGVIFEGISYFSWASELVWLKGLGIRL